MIIAVVNEGFEAGALTLGHGDSSQGLAGHGEKSLLVFLRAIFEIIVFSLGLLHFTSVMCLPTGSW